MTQVEAVYRGGKFEPLGPVDLAEEQRVVLRYERELKPDLATWFKETQSLREAIAKRTGVLPDSTADIAADRMR
ncbi:MAG TPA: antitoxin family protein [Phycisphaerae bacterium]|nr:antitoxin family protein [Phycisphaerae bacterium]